MTTIIIILYLKWIYYRKTFKNWAKLKKGPFTYYVSNTPPVPLVSKFTNCYCGKMSVL